MRPARDRLGVRLVGDQRIGRKRQDLVEDEEREQVLREGDAHRRPQRHRETDVEARLTRLVVAAHIADRIDRIDDPQRRGDEREQHPERLDLEREAQARHDGDVERLRPRAGQHMRQQAPGCQAESAGRHQRHRLADIRMTVEQRDHQRAEQRDRQGGKDQGFGRKGQHHLSPPSSVSAIRLATPTVSCVSMPK